jgi:manganese efflux pump family protein
MHHRRIFAPMAYLGGHDFARADPRHHLNRSARRMAFLTVIGLALALAMDAFAVALSAGAYLVKADGHQTFRLSFHFGLFQFLMPILGWIAGAQFVSYISSIDHWIAFGLLAFIGGRMVRSSLRESEAAIKSDVTKGWSLVTLSVATSIDAFAVGLSLAVLERGIVMPSIVIGIVAAAMTLIGIRLGERLSSRFGRRMELLGGIVLIVIGIRVVLEHLAAR